MHRFVPRYRMKIRTFASFILLGFAWVAGLEAAAKDSSAKARDTATGLKAPELKVDATPVSDGKSPVLTSYADVIDPVQKAVVSVYSTKIVRERVAVNPLLRQFFGEIPDQEREHKEEGLGSGVIISADGYILTKNIKSDNRFDGIPVVMHSSLSSEANRSMGKAVGVDSYVAKFDAEALAETLRPLLLKSQRD